MGGLDGRIRWEDCMKKKALIFALLVFALVFVLLYLVAWSLPHPKKDLKKVNLKQARVVTKKIKPPQKVRVIALVQHGKAEKKIIKKPEKQKKHYVPKARTKKVLPQPKNRTAVRRLASKKMVANSDIVSKGRILISRNKPMPLIQTSYDDIGFYRYLKHMKAIGGRLFVGDALEKRIVGEAVLYDNGYQYEFVGFKDRIDDLAPMALFRPREIMDEPLAIEIISRAKSQFDNGDFRCVVILPIDKEAAILGALDDYLQGHGYPISGFGMIKGRYFMSDGKLTLRLKQGVLRKPEDTIAFDMELII